jgi:hypothetical protein
VTKVPTSQTKGEAMELSERIVLENRGKVSTSQLERSSKMKRMVMITLMALVAGMSFPVTAMATLSLNVNFDVLPTDVSLGWSSNFGNGGVDPDTQVSGGIWDMDNIQPGFSNYSRADHTSLLTGTPTQYHGRVVIDHVDFSPTATSSTEVELVFLKDPTSQAQVWLNAVDGGLDYNIGGAWIQIATELITTGVHTYDWLTTIAGGGAVTTDVWVDGTQIAFGIDTKFSGGTPISTDLIGFGDAQTNAPGSGGGTGAEFDQHHKWDSFHIGQGAGEGPIPEPATLTLLGLGCGLMLLRRRRSD